MKKPLVSLIAGKDISTEKRMGHAGAIVSLGSGFAREKIEALESVGALVAEFPSQIPSLVKNALCI